jgi:hypothetical protein
MRRHFRVTGAWPVAVLPAILAMLVRAALGAESPPADSAGRPPTAAGSAAAAAPAQTTGSPPALQHQVIGKGPGGCSLEIAAGPGSILDKDDLILKDYVDIRCGDLRLQADLVHYIPSTHEAHAEGNVVLDQAKSRITADSLDYNLETGTGQFINARGYAEPAILFEAARVEQTSKDELVLYDASFTACTQPVPYWSFKLSKGTLRLGEYAYLHDLQFKIGHATVFYSPYLVWPIKSDRASGLLFPSFGFSKRSGTVLSMAWYWAMRRNMDATFFEDWMSKAGLGTGVEYRYVPSPTGRGLFTGYFIRDQVAKEQQKPGVPTDRWVIDYNHQQELGSEWHFTVNANFVSDFDYYLDFERDIRLSSNPQAVSRAYLSRNWGFYSLNMWGERREQLVQQSIDPAIGQPILAVEQGSIIRLTAPEIQFRSRRQRLGSAPLFFSLESSADNFDKGDRDALYQRVDVAPVLSSQLSPVPWLDIDANAGVRETYYTKSQGADLGCDNLPGTHDFGEGNGAIDHEPDINGNGIFDPEDDVGCDGIPNTGDYGEGNGVYDFERSEVTEDNPINRRIYQAGMTVIGPKLTRVYDTPGSTFSKQFKNTIEPTLRYTYLSAVDNPADIIKFDAIDTITGNTNMLTYSLVTRLFARRPVAGADQLGADYMPVGAGDRGPQDVLAKALEKVRADKAKEAAAAAGGEAAAGGGPPGGGPQLSTVEVASLEIGQDYSFLGPLSSSFALGTTDPFTGVTKPFTSPVSPIRAVLRVNPSINTSIDMRTSYDVLFKQIKDASLSANLRSPGRGFIDLTWTMQRDLEGKALQEEAISSGQPVVVLPFSPSQLNLSGETALFSRRFLIGFQTNMDIGDIQPGQPRLREQRYRAGYNTQCCGFQVEYLDRNYVGSSLQEFRFLINLKGVGNVVDLHEGVGGGL